MASCSIGPTATLPSGSGGAWLLQASAVGGFRLEGNCEDLPMAKVFMLLQFGPHTVGIVLPIE